MLSRHRTPINRSGSANKSTSLIKRSYTDRRSPVDRRQIYSMDYFLAGGTERRKMWHERRKQKEERRHGWVRVSVWSSVHVGEHTDTRMKRRIIE